MGFRIGGFVSVIVLCLSYISPLATAEIIQPRCTLCIAEFQTLGQNGEEDQDFVIIANVTAGTVTSSSIQLRYSNSLGVFDSSLGIGTFTAGQTKIYASDALKTVNSSATKLPMALYSGGGSLQIARTSGAITTVYDRVGWGTALLAETTAIASNEAGTVLTRSNTDGIIRDTDNNNVDFEAKRSMCKSLKISELQPFVTDVSGQAILAWIELTGHSDDVGDCRLLTATGDRYTIPSGSLPLAGEIALIDEAIDDLKTTVPLRIGDTSGQVWVGPGSTYGGVNALFLPAISQAYTNVLKGQSWADIGGVWKRTYQPTPLAENAYLAAPVVSQADPNACVTVFISELMPNPNGEDTDREWLELHNNSDAQVSLMGCQVNIDGTVYHFLPDDSLGPQEWRVSYSLYDESGSEKTISLKNSDTNLIALQRDQSGVIETLQAFEYADAPEGQSYGRFDAGWRWLISPNPGLDNSSTAQPVGTITPNEFPGSSPVSDPDNVGQMYLPLSITELLPNPEPPKTDDNDEFVEIYNPNSAAVNLKDYKLQAGSTYGNSYTFDEQIIEPGAHVVITSGNSSLTLANGGGKARLLTPAGLVVSETDTYGSAGSGQSWAFIDNKWRWTNVPTPGAINTYAAIPLLSAASAAAKTAKKVTAPKAAAAKKAAVPKANAKKTAVKAASTTAKPALASSAGTTNAPPLHASVLAIIGLLAVGYALHEYRKDIANRFYQFNRYRKDWAAARAASKRR